MDEKRPMSSQKCFITLVLEHFFGGVGHRRKLKGVRGFTRRRRMSLTGGTLQKIREPNARTPRRGIFGTLRAHPPPPLAGLTLRR